MGDWQLKNDRVMDKINRITMQLRAAFVACVVLGVVIISVFETRLGKQGGLAGDKTAEFITYTVMILLTIVLIPFALKLHKTGLFKRAMASGETEPYARYRLFANSRIALLGALWLLNGVFYEIFLRAGFGYLAIIGLVSMVFVWPTKARMRQEMGLSDTDGKEGTQA